MTGIQDSQQQYKKGEVYFLSHGGPPTMFETTSGPYQAWKKYGKLVEAAKPRGLVVVSAHWENPNRGDGVIVNTDPSNPLYYDFYNFPKHYYEVTFKSRGDKQMLEDILKTLKSSEIEVETTKRGLDHGVFVPFLVAFNGATEMPIVQVSLPGDGSPVSAAKLGKSLALLRQQGYGIMGTGQAVHNLRDLFSGRPMTYTKPFMQAIKTSLQSPKPLESTMTLFRHPLYKQAHPTPEHLLPLAVAVGAVEEGDKLEEIYADIDGLGWGMWRCKEEA